MSLRSDYDISLFSLVFLVLFCRFSWVYFQKRFVKLGHRFSYQFRETLPLSGSPAGDSLP